MNIQELQTLKNLNLNLKTFILNNKCYGITKQFQDTHFEGRYEACGPKGYKPPEFEEIVEAYGIDASYIHSNNNLARLIKMVLDYRKSVVCNVNIGDWHTYEPRVVGWDTPIEDLSPRLSREELRENMI